MKKVNYLLVSILLCLIFTAAGWTRAEAAEIIAPTNLAATAVSSSQVNLTWTDSSDNEKGFIIERKSLSGSYTEIGSVEPNTTAFSDTGLPAAAAYSYRVKAYYDGGESNYSNVVSLTTGTTVPETPNNLTATAVSSSRIDLAWTDLSDNEKGFKIERKASGGSYSQIATVGANATTYTSSGLSTNTRYYYRVSAYNDAGGSAYSNEADATTETAVPGVPGNLKATVISSSRIDLTWTDLSDNEKGFKIERKASGGSYSQIATLGANATTYTSSGLATNTRYYYRVRAYNDAGNSAYSNEASVTTGTTVTVPNAPEKLEASSLSTSKIKLTWSDRSNDEDGFEIERKKSGGSYSQIATVSRNITTYTNSGLSDDTRYYYRVRAYNDAGNSTYSNEAGATTGATVPNAPDDLEAVSVSTSKIKLTWDDESNDESGFKIERKKSGGSYSQIATVSRNITTYTNSGLSDDTRYYYRVRAYNDAGNSTYSNEASATTGATVPNAPDDLEAVSVSTSKIKLTWDDESNDESGFKIERKKSGGSYSQIATVGKNVTTYTNSGLANDTKYYYRVRAYNDAGNSAYSREASATTGEEQTIIKLVIGDPSYYVNNKIKTMDTAPFIMENRTLLPIRYIAEALGARVDWDNTNRKVTITIEGSKIELWIEKSYAMVGSEYRAIDEANPKVKPIIVSPGRTMLPLRFIAENLGCRVDWDPDRSEVTVTYPAP